MYKWIIYRIKFGLVCTNLDQGSPKFIYLVIHLVSKYISFAKKHKDFFALCVARLVCWTFEKFSKVRKSRLNIFRGISFIFHYNLENFILHISKTGLKCNKVIMKCFHASELLGGLPKYYYLHFILEALHNYLLTLYRSTINDGSSIPRT